MSGDIIQLRRVGFSNSLTARHNGCFIELGVWPDGRCTLCITTTYGEDSRCKVLHQERYSDLDAAKTEVLRLMNGGGRSHPVDFSPFVEAYMYYNDNALRIWPHVAGDKFLACAVYEQATDTVRMVPENYCLIAWMMEGNEPFRDIDAATIPYREQVKRALDEYAKPHNQRNSDRENKSWLAWLVSEYIKEAHPDRKPVVLDSMSR